MGKMDNVCPPCLSIIEVHPDHLVHVHTLFDGMFKGQSCLCIVHRIYIELCFHCNYRRLKENIGIVDDCIDLKNWIKRPFIKIYNYVLNCCYSHTGGRGRWARDWVKHKSFTQESGGWNLQLQLPIFSVVTNLSDC